MNNLRNLLKIEEQKYRALDDKLGKTSIDLIPGTLVILERNKSYQYYHRYKLVDRVEREFIPKKEISKAVHLAKQQYLLKLKKLVKRRISQLSRLSKDYQVDEIDRIYLNLHPGKKILFKPFVPTAKERLDFWIEKDYPRKGFGLDDPELFTRRGERVRSKSEMILADLLDEMGIAYKYEKPLYFDRGIVIHPDFTFFDPVSGKEIYWEHNGMMDTPNYAIKACRKIILYEKNGIFRGENLIVTYEYSNNSLDKAWARMLINKFLK